MRRVLVVAGAFAVLCAAGPAGAEACRRPVEPGAAASSRLAPCKSGERLRPYEPGQVRPGSRPGFIDVGNGTEVRVGGSVRMDYDVRR